MIMPASEGQPYSVSRICASGQTLSRTGAHDEEEKMATTIGIFEREGQVLDAVERIRSSAGTAKSLRIIVKNGENAPLLAGHAEAPVEEVAGVQGTLTRSDDMDAGFAGEDAGIAAAAWVAPLQGGGSSGNASALPVLGLLRWNRDDADIGGTLKQMGIPPHAVRSCAEAVDEGKFVLVAEGGSIERNDALFRQAGAVDVLY
jgi:hypothetical protein